MQIFDFSGRFFSRAFAYEENGFARLSLLIESQISPMMCQTVAKISVMVIKK